MGLFHIEYGPFLCSARISCRRRCCHFTVTGATAANQNSRTICLLASRNEQYHTNYGDKTTTREPTRPLILWISRMPWKSTSNPLLFRRMLFTFQLCPPFRLHRRCCKQPPLRQPAVPLAPPFLLAGHSAVATGFLLFRVFHRLRCRLRRLLSCRHLRCRLCIYRL